VRHESGSSTVYAIKPALHPIATYYRNTIVHHFLDKAIIELSLYKARAIGEGDPASVFWAETERLRDLFKFEFFYPPKTQFRENLQAELNRTDPLWATRLEAGGAALNKLLARLQPLVGHAVLLPYVEAYSIVFELLVRLKQGERLDENDCATQALQQSRQAYLLRRITSEASIGKILFQNAYRLAANFGLAAETDDQVINARKVLLREFREISRRMERMRLDMLANADENSDREWL
jgi:glycerol-3-phosphate O-acyltransferase